MYESGRSDTLLTWSRPTTHHVALHVRDRREPSSPCGVGAGVVPARVSPHSGLLMDGWAGVRVSALLCVACAVAAAIACVLVVVACELKPDE